MKKLGFGAVCERATRLNFKAKMYAWFWLLNIIEYFEVPQLREMVG